MKLLRAMGYGGSFAGAGLRLGRTGDGGIDGIVKEDKLGLDVIYLQAKRWDGSVGAPVVQGFVGALDGKRAQKGVFITTGQFTEGAKRYVNETTKRIVLIDGDQLADFMIEHGIGVTSVQTYQVWKIDSDFFDDSD